LDAVAIAGGCGMNSVANGKVMLKTPFKQIYVQSAAGDAGGAIGAAYSVWQKLGGERGPVHDHAYWGPFFSNENIGNLLTNRSADLVSQGCQVTLFDDEFMLYQKTAEAIASGEVVGWFQGRMEWGPRALGNRSIIGDPRRANMKDILNLKIKRRESFRPFAPSVLQAAVGEWFEQSGDVPFMMQVFQIRKDKRALIPAVTHVDGSGRLQTVHRDTNSRYYMLIEKFYELTGVPMVLNTSFNENEPVVCHPEEALDCFLRTQMDVLFMGNWVITRNIG
jgi:carbamoyltransferase